MPSEMHPPVRRGRGRPRKDDPIAAPAEGAGVEAVDRALSIVSCFGDGDRHLDLAEIARRTGLYKSTILRLAVSIERAGYIVRHADRSFTLGPEVMRLGALYQGGFRLEPLVRPVLAALAAKTFESVSFYRREGDQRVCLFRQDSEHPIRDHIREGDILPLRIGAGGHVLTQFGAPGLADAERRLLLSRLPFVSRGERDAETAAMAVPVFGAHGTLAGALSLSGTVTRFSDTYVANMAPVLIEAGKDLSRVLGGMAAWEK